MENFSKNKRGRPIKHFLLNNDNYMNTVLQGSQNVKTKRGKSNVFYLYQVLEIFLDKDGHNYKVKNKLHYFLIKENSDGNFKPFKKTILAELGKVCLSYSEKDVLRLADEICRNKYNTDRAINFIREMRGIRKNKIDGTLNKIITLINNAGLSKKEIAEVYGKIGELIIIE